MVFNDTATELGICQEIDAICGSDTTRYPVAQKTRRANMALDRFVYLAATADGVWQFDDTNYSDLPIGVTNLVSGQQDYTFASDVLLVSKVLCKASDGVFSELYPVDLSETRRNMAARNTWDLPSNNGGNPRAYDKFANSILLDPIPNYASVGGLKVVFQRIASYFTASDTTKEPGIPKIFHMFIARYAALPYLIQNKIASKNDVAAQIQQDELAIGDFFSHRNKDDTSSIKPKYRSSR